VFGNDAQLVAASNKGHRLKEAIETLIKGPELSLIAHGELAYLHKGGHERDQARLRRWTTGSTLNELAEMTSTFQHTGRDAVPGAASGLDRK
jgi:hypothetical protein